VKSASDFYVAGGGVTGIQNGWAIAGGLSFGRLLPRIAGLISQYGYDGFMYSVGWLVAYITVLAADRRALPQHRQVHAAGHPRLPQQPEGDAHRGALS